MPLASCMFLVCSRFGGQPRKEIVQSCLTLCSPMEDFPDSSVGKESVCNAGDPSLIPGSGRSAGEGIGYPLQYSWASLMVQLVKNPPAMQETWVRSLGWEDPLEKGLATHSSILAWRIPCLTLWLVNFHFQTFFQGRNWSLS